MVLCGFAFLCLVGHGCTWLHIVSHGREWFCLVARDFAWFRVVLLGFLWFRVVLRGFVWSRVFCLLSRSFASIVSRGFGGFAWFCMVLHVVLNDLCDSHDVCFLQSCVVL